MSNLLTDALLFATLAFFGVHVVLVGILTPRLPAASQQVLCAWASVRGGQVLSLKFKYLLPWVSLPPLSRGQFLLLRSAQASASIAMLALLAMILSAISMA
ncbi:hypothetical protein [Rhodanobacter sp. C03]|uniref:hypothetical protein n=1 Tax=Rhodanobacter sp. C03 TaxID=1945858 RepID=UPI00098764E0|nr:hypothetical protein [Rhodanobacter sp. C03]OOG52329.1 hypothetical protein B0E48_17325 [Rhodanobacter sp. C03]